MSTLRLSASIAGVLLVTACAGVSPVGTGASGSASGTVSADVSAPSISATASPSLAPDLLASGGIRCDLTGAVKDVPLQLYGLFDVLGNDDHLLVVQEGLGEPFVYEELTSGPRVWSRSNGDPWGSAKGAADVVARLRKSIDEASGWADVGAAGPALRRLKAAGTPLDASDFGLEYPGGIDTSLSLEVETASDGSPAVMHIAGLTLRAELRCGRRPLSHPAAPLDWKRVELSHGVSLAIPEEWELDGSDPDRLTVTGPDRQWLSVQGATAKGLTLEAWTSDGAAYFSSNWNAKLDETTVITVAGEQAVLATWHVPIDGIQTHFLDVAAVRDGWGYDIEFFSQTEREPADRALFEQVLTTVDFGKP